MSELPESQKMTDVQQVHQTPTPPSKPFQRSGDNKGNHGRGKHQQPKFPKLMGDIDQMGGGASSVPRTKTADDTSLTKM